MTTKIDWRKLPGPDTSTKWNASESSDPRMQALLREAIATGWPAAFENDLYQHDLAVLEEYPDQDMVWILRDHGTHLFPVRCTFYGTAKWARTVCQYHSGDHKLNTYGPQDRRPIYYHITADGRALRITPDTAYSMIRVEQAQCVTS
ncbi:MAG: hypothetical protein ACOY3P_20285 [Planctomycetota bacterium]